MALRGCCSPRSNTSNWRKYPAAAGNSALIDLRLIVGRVIKVDALIRKALVQLLLLIALRIGERLFPVGVDELVDIVSAEIRIGKLPNGTEINPLQVNGIVERSSNLLALYISGICNVPLRV